MGLSKTVVRSDTRWAALVLNDLGCFFSSCSCSCSCFFPIFCNLLSLLFPFFFLGLFVDNDDDDDDEIPTMILAYDAYDACRILLTLIQRFQGYKKYPVEWVGD